MTHEVTILNDEDTNRIPVEELFSSRGRVRILKELAISSELLISELCRRVSLNHSSTKSHLKVLVASGLVEEKKHGRIKLYRYRIEDTRARAIRNLFNLWDSR
jgi:DNA-binding transcriptional ArsR family regulator